MFRFFILCSENISASQNNWYIMEATPDGYIEPEDLTGRKVHKRRKDAKAALLEQYPGIKQAKGGFVLPL